MAIPLLRWAPTVLVLCSALLAVDACWIPLKAKAGQWLLERAWVSRLEGNLQARPWPWADTRPAGVLSIPRLKLRQLMLEGASGRNMAWGPTLLSPSGSSDVVLTAHRDTHFQKVRKLRPGDEISLITVEGKRDYRVAWLDIVDSRREQIVFEPGRNRLTLVTCYPFNAVGAGGPLRLVVTALPVASKQASLKL